MDIPDPKTLARPIRPLKMVDDDSPKFLITMENVMRILSMGVGMVEIIDWLLEV